MRQPSYKPSYELKRLGGIVEALKTASMFNAQERGRAALSQVMRVLCDMEERIQKMEGSNDTQGRG